MGVKRGSSRGDPTSASVMAEHVPHTDDEVVIQVVKGVRAQWLTALRQQPLLHDSVHKLELRVARAEAVLDAKCEANERLQTQKGRMRGAVKAQKNKGNGGEGVRAMTSTQIMENMWTQAENRADG